MSDPVTFFVRQLEAFVGSNDDVLDVGAGAGLNNTYSFRGRCNEVVGVDMDPRVLSNPLLDRGVVGDILKLPFESESFSVAFSIYVLEHIKDPPKFSQEIHRVLKPGGVFMALTPNFWHYVPLVASFTPHAFHRWFNQKRGRSCEDTFPTYYRLNSRIALRRHFLNEGFDEIFLKFIEVQPNYLKWCVPAFLCGALYERVVNSSELFAGCRVNVVCAYRKRPS